MNSIGDGALKLGPSHSALFSFGKDFSIGEAFTISTEAHFTFSHLLPQSESLIRGTQHAVDSAFDVDIAYRDYTLQLSQPTYFQSPLPAWRIRRILDKRKSARRNFAYSASQYPNRACPA